MWALYYLCNFTYSCHLPLIIIFNMIDMQRTKESNPNNPIAEIVPLLPHVCVCVCSYIAYEFKKAHLNFY